MTKAVPSGPRRSRRSPGRRDAIHSPPGPSGFTMSSISPSWRRIRLKEYGRRRSGSNDVPGRTCTNCPARACAAIPGALTPSTVPRSPMRALAVTAPCWMITATRSGSTSEPASRRRVAGLAPAASLRLLRGLLADRPARGLLLTFAPQPLGFADLRAAPAGGHLVRQSRRTERYEDRARHAPSIVPGTVSPSARRTARITAASSVRRPARPRAHGSGSPDPASSALRRRGRCLA